jgi:hypothetical protein
MKTIYEFKKGDEIVRVENAKPIQEGGIRDRSYVGEKMIFAGIANGVIYLKPTTMISTFLAGKEKLMDLPLDTWDEGWDYWVDPNTLLDNILDEKQIKSKLSEAIAEENYELANQLQKMLNDTK